MREILTIGMVAELLNTHVNTVRGWCNKGKINFYYTPGGHRRIYLSDIEQYISLEMLGKIQKNKNTIHIKGSCNEICFYRL